MHNMQVGVAKPLRERTIALRKSETSPSKG